MQKQKQILILFILFSTSLNAQLQKIVKNDSIGVYLEQSLTIQYGNIIVPVDSAHLYWTSNPVSQVKMSKVTFPIGDTLWFNGKGFFAAFVTGFYPMYLYNNGYWEPVYNSDGGSATVRRSTNSVIHVGNNMPQMDVVFSTVVGKTNMVITTNAYKTKVRIMQVGGFWNQYYLPQLNGQGSFVLTKNLPAGIYELWLEGFYHSLIQPSYFWKFRFIVH